MLRKSVQGVVKKSHKTSQDHAASQGINQLDPSSINAEGVQLMYAAASRTVSQQILFWEGVITEVLVADPEERIQNNHARIGTALRNFLSLNTHVSDHIQTKEKQWYAQYNNTPVASVSDKDNLSEIGLSQLDELADMYNSLGKISKIIADYYTPNALRHRNADPLAIEIRHTNYNRSAEESLLLSETLITGVTAQRTRIVQAQQAAEQQKKKAIADSIAHGFASFKKGEFDEGFLDFTLALSQESDNPSAKFGLRCHDIYNMAKKGGKFVSKAQQSYVALSATAGLSEEERSIVAMMEVQFPQLKQTQTSVENAAPLAPPPALPVVEKAITPKAKADTVLQATNTPLSQDSVQHNTPLNEDVWETQGKKNAKQSQEKKAAQPNKGRQETRKKAEYVPDSTKHHKAEAPKSSQPTQTKVNNNPVSKSVISTVPAAIKKGSDLDKITQALGSATLNPVQTSHVDAPLVEQSAAIPSTVVAAAGINIAKAEIQTAPLTNVFMPKEREANSLPPEKTEDIRSMIKGIIQDKNYSHIRNLQGIRWRADAAGNKDIPFLIDAYRIFDTNILNSQQQKFFQDRIFAQDGILLSDPTRQPTPQEWNILSTIGQGAGKKTERESLTASNFLEAYIRPYTQPAATQMQR